MKILCYIKCIAAASLFMVLAPLHAMPPHPDLEEKFAREGRSTDPAKIIDIERSKSTVKMSRATSFASGTIKLPVLLVQFADASVNGGSTAAFYSELLNGATDASLSVKRYYRDMSAGKLTIEFDVYGPFTVSKNLSYYGNNLSGITGNDEHPGEFVNEGINLLVAAHGSVDFSRYDNDGNGTVDAVIVIHAGRGEEVTGTAAQIWSHQWDLAGAKNRGDGDGPVITDGVAFNVYTVQPEYVNVPGDTTIGVFCHELGHVFGLPDLYDTSGATSGVGNWSLMGTGSWGDDATGARPAPLLAWERFRTGGRGWLNLTSIDPPGYVGRDYRGLQFLILLLMGAMAAVSVLSLSRYPLAGKGAVLLSGAVLSAVISCGTDTTSISINGTINDIEESRHAFRIRLNDPYDEQYLFLEGKKTSAGGWYVPGTGILITHVHEGMVDAYFNSGAVNAGALRVHGVNVVEASAGAEPGDLWSGTAYKGSAADLFCAENNDELSVATTPGTKYYTDDMVSTKTGDSGVTIEDISSNASFPMTFTAVVD